jgi:hypothetical protein
MTFDPLSAIHGRVDFLFVVPPIMYMLPNGLTAPSVGVYTDKKENQIFLIYV